MSVDDEFPPGTKQELECPTRSEPLGLSTIEVADEEAKRLIRLEDELARIRWGSDGGNNPD